MLNNRLLITAVVLSFLTTGQAMAQQKFTGLQNKHVELRQVPADMKMVSKHISLRTQDNHQAINKKEVKSSNSVLVPEPTGFFALCTGIIGLVGLRRRRR